MEYSSKESLIKYFGDEIEKRSSIQIASLQKEIAITKKNELAKIETEVQQQVALSLGVKLQDILEKYRNDINALMNENAQKLFERRNQIAKEIMAEVISKLEKMVKSEQYSAYLEARLIATEAIFHNEKLTFFIASNDEVAKKAILKIMGSKLEIKIDTTIQLGGFRVISTESMQEIDETIDCKLENKKAWFYANSKLFIKK
ncbi:MAG: hypothetical protein WC479_09520 [Candidatus Izemoplasmatales bacterium]|jgi:vacuolar-type H+-ATPase subunit E/Vma4|nr:hypothetical protein [Candidatus Izemoplasmatales bacterium]MDD3865919.1 hypothetical protein [Candidatus Izemoplasmatales bacterium]